MAKLVLTDITGSYASVAALNANFALTETALENTLSRDGTTPNTMLADIDLNNNDLLNVRNIEAQFFKDENGVLVAFADYTGTVASETFSGNGSTLSFAVTVTPVASSNLSVFIDGVYQQKATYTVSGTNIIFSEAPPLGTNNIEIIVISSLPIGSTTADLVGYTPAGTGAVATTVQNKLRESVSVKDFGAVGDGIANDTVAIQTAVNTGKAIFFPQGTYKITTAIQLSTAGQNLFGIGDKSILLTTTDIETMYSSTPVYGVVISNLFFSNTVSEGAGGPTKFQIHFGTGASGCVVRECNFLTALTGAVVRTTHHAGIWYEGANLNSILDCTFGQAQILMGSTDSTIRGGFVYSFSFEYAIKIVSTGEVLVTDVRGILGGPAQGCIWMPNSGLYNKIVNNYFGGTYSNINIGNAITGDEQQALHIGGNTFHSVDGIGVYLTNSTGVSITGNNFFAGDPKQNDPTFLIPGNQDILIESNIFQSTNVVITDNTFRRFNGPIEDGMPGIGKSYSIQFSGAFSAVNNVLSDNTFSNADRYYSPAIAGVAPQNTKVGNIGIGTELINQIAGDLNLGASGKFVNVSNIAEVAPAGTLTLSVNPAAGFVGILSVGNVLTGTLGFSTRTVFGVSSTGTALVVTSLATQNGATSGLSFTVTQPSAGLIQITDTSGSAANLQLSASFSGMATFAG